MTTMITPKRDLYFKNCDPLPENLYGKEGEWYIIREYNNGDLVFTSETGNDHTYDEKTLNKDYYTIDFERGFSYKFREQEYTIKDYKWGCETKVPVETCVICIERGYWKITRYSNEPSKEENSSEKLRNYWCDFVEEKSILASFPVPEDDVKKCTYEESLYSTQDLLGDRTLEQFWFEFDKLPEPCNPHNPVKNISREKYYRCAKSNPNPCEQFNSERGVLFMSESTCGKYYYWQGHNSKNEIIYFRGEKSWVEANYEKREGFEEDNLMKVLAETREGLEKSLSDGEIYQYYEDSALFKADLQTKVDSLYLDFTQHVAEIGDGLERSISEESDTLPKDSNTEKNITTWTDKHYNFSYTLTESDIENGEIKIDPYFVNRMWRINSWDDTGAAFHSLKNYARICNGKNPLERDLKSLYQQVLRLCELHGVEL